MSEELKALYLAMLTSERIITKITKRPGMMVVWMASYDGDYPYVLYENER